MSMKTKVGGMWCVGEAERGLRARGWGLGDEGLPADTCQYHSVNLFHGSRRPAGAGREFVFRRNEAGMSVKTKDHCGKLWS